MRNFGSISRFFSVLAGVFLFSHFASANIENTKNYKLISTVECKGDGVYNNRYETRFRVNKEPLGDNTFRYGIVLDGAGKEMSFILNRDTLRMSDSDQNFQFQEHINNICVQSLDKNTTGNINKTWKQSFDLSSLGKPYPLKLSFTLTSLKMSTKKAGDMIVVRALSEPFEIQTDDPMKCRINSACVFDPAVENLTMSASVVTVESVKPGSPKSILCHQTAVIQTDSQGQPIDLGFKEDAKTGDKFAEFMRKVGLREKMLVVEDKNKTDLPLWAKTDALKVSQVSNLCAGYACENGVNPVGPIFITANHAISMQSAGFVGTTGSISVGQTLAANLSTAPLATTASFMGVGAGTAALVGGGAAAGLSGGGGGGGGGSASP